MNVLRKSGLLPHECFFGLFQLVFFIKLLAAVGPSDVDTLICGGLLALNVGVVLWCRKRDGKGWWLLRLWIYPVMMNVIFMNMKSSVMKVNAHKWDAWLSGGDRFLFGDILSLRAEALITPLLTETLSFFYLWFFPYLMFSWFYYAWRGVPVLKKLFIGMFTIYGIGFLGYLLVPAGGPHLAYPEEFSIPLTGWAITRFNEFIVSNGSNGVDVFPSLHCGMSCFLLFFDRRHALWRYRLYLVPCFGIWVATIYLRYHYAIDLLAGFLLAAFALWVVRKWENDPIKSPAPSTP